MRTCHSDLFECVPVIPALDAGIFHIDCRVEHGNDTNTKHSNDIIAYPGYDISGAGNGTNLFECAAPGHRRIKLKKPVCFNMNKILISRVFVFVEHIIIDYVSVFCKKLL